MNGADQRAKQTSRIIELDTDEDDLMEIDLDEEEAHHVVIVDANWTHVLSNQMSVPNTNPGIRETWCIDSGASHNICHDKNQFVAGSMKETAVDIRLGNDKVVRVTKKGLIQLSEKLKIEALYAPEFRISLLSTSYLNQVLSLKTEFYKGIAIVRDTDNMVHLRGHLERGLYIYKQGAAYTVTTRRMAQEAPNFEVVIPIRDNDILPDVPQPPTPIEAPDEDVEAPDHLIERQRGRKATPMEWHQRLGHLNGVAMKRLLKADQVQGQIPNQFDCEVCKLSKHQVKVNRAPVIRTTRPFERIHSDLCGPFTCGSWKGSIYFIVYICDATRYPAVYFLPTKQSVDVIARWRHFRAWIQSKGYNIKEFRSDNGTGEFDNDNFKAELPTCTPSYAVFARWHAQ